MNQVIVLVPGNRQHAPDVPVQHLPPVLADQPQVGRVVVENVPEPEHAQQPLVSARFVHVVKPVVALEARMVDVGRRNVATLEGAEGLVDRSQGQPVLVGEQIVLHPRPRGGYPVDVLDGGQFGIGRVVRSRRPDQGGDMLIEFSIRIGFGLNAQAVQQDPVPVRIADPGVVVLEITPHLSRQGDPVRKVGLRPGRKGNEKRQRNQ